MNRFITIVNEIRQKDKNDLNPLEINFCSFFNYIMKFFFVIGDIISNIETKFKIDLKDRKYKYAAII